MMRMAPTFRLHDPHLAYQLCRWMRKIAEGFEMMASRKEDPTLVEDIADAEMESLHAKQKY